MYGALATSCADGHARTIAKDLEKAGTLSAYLFMECVTKTYNTPLTQCNFFVHALRQLIDVKLDNHTSSHEFVSDFRETINRMADNGVDPDSAKLFLRAFFIVAVSTTAFAQEQTWIIDHPGKSINDYLGRIQQRDQLHNAQEGIDPVQEDLNPHPKAKARRGRGQGNDYGGKKFKFSDDMKDNRYNPWKVPKFPES